MNRAIIRKTTLSELSGGLAAAHSTVCHPSSSLFPPFSPLHLHTSTTFVETRTESCPALEDLFHLHGQGHEAGKGREDQEDPGGWCCGRDRHLLWELAVERTKLPR